MAQNFRQFNMQKTTRSKKIDMPLIANSMVAERLVRHVIVRMELAKQMRDRRISGFQKIDNQLFRQPQDSKAQPTDIEEKSDLERRKDLLSGKSVKPCDHNFGFAQMQLEDVEAFIMRLLAPDMDLFEAVASKDDQPAANAVAAELNKEGVGIYYQQLFLFVRSALRYNQAAMSVLWEKHTGRVLSSEAGGTISAGVGTTWEGNMLIQHDPYNFFFDTAVPLTRLTKNGEYYAWVEKLTGFAAKRMEEQGRMFGVNRFTSGFGDTVAAVSPSATTYYEEPPVLAPNDDEVAEMGITNWGQFLGVADARDSVPSLEVIHFVCWIDPIEFAPVAFPGSQPGTMELWRFDVVNGKYLANAVRIDDTHGMLPVVCANPRPDVTTRRLPSLAEYVLPLGQFGSFLLNSHQASVRKALGGITLFDENKLPLARLPKGDLIGAKIPINNLGSNQGVDAAFKQLVDVPQTGDYLTQMQVVLQVMRQMAPADYNNQMADLQRATQFQAAAVMQGGSTQNLVLTKLLYEQALVNMSVMMTRNLYYHKGQISYLDPVTKQQTQVPVAQLLDSSIEYSIGTGIRGVDRLMMIQNYKDMLGLINQSQQAMQRIDIVKLLNYISSLSGDKTDLSNFEMSEQQQMQQATIAAMAKQAASSQAPSGQVPSAPQGLPTT